MIIIKMKTGVLHLSSWASFSHIYIFYDIANLLLKLNKLTFSKIILPTYQIQSNMNIADIIDLLSQILNF